MYPVTETIDGYTFSKEPATKFCAARIKITHPEQPDFYLLECDVRQYLRPLLKWLDYLAVYPGESVRPSDVLGPENPGQGHPPESVSQEAMRIIRGDRRKAYGPVRESFERNAAVWSAVFKHPVTVEQVALCMIGLKLCREANSHQRDNLVDLVGYVELLDQLVTDSERTPAAPASDAR